MKLLIIGDVQAHAWKSYPSTDANGVNLRLLDHSRELNRLAVLAVKNRVDAVVVLGDIFEARNAIEVPVLNQMYYAFRTFSDGGVRVILLVGNHDRTGTGAEHALEIFKSFCDVVDVPMTFPFDGGDAVAIPYHPDPKVIDASIKECVTEDTQLLFMHCAVRSLPMPNGKLWGEGISLEAIPRHVTCLLGHYHKFAELRTGKVFYVGSLLQEDRSDAGTVKYYAVYDSSKERRKRLRFIPTQGPRFVSLAVEQHMRGFYNGHSELISGNFVTVSSIPPGVTDLGAVETAIREQGAREVLFAVQTQMPSTPPTLAAESANEDIITEYVNQADTNLDKPTLSEVGMTIVTRAEARANRVEQGVSDTVDRGDSALDEAFDAFLRSDPSLDG